MGTTEKVLYLKNYLTVNELSELLGISRGTIYVRLRKQNWKKPEIELIKCLNLKKYV
tara:strand:+ start:5110 stop:5280 length:171 start_codon:yes stop_codon:yes gene_type:complete